MVISAGRAIDDEDADAVRKVAFGYWAAFNAYDPDKALSYVEAEYRRQCDETVRHHIGLVESFRVKLGLTEEAPPAMTGPDEGEMYLTMKEPLGARRIHMAFRKIGGEWMITLTEQVE